MSSFLRLLASQLPADLQHADHILFIAVTAYCHRAGCPLSEAWWFDPRLLQSACRSGLGQAQVAPEGVVSHFPFTTKPQEKGGCSSFSTYGHTEGETCCCSIHLMGDGAA